MERREALKNMAVLLGGALITSATMGVLFESCDTPANKSMAKLTPEQTNLIGELAETIIPKTNTPGAKEAGVGRFMAMMITECYPEKVQNVFLDGLNQLDKDAKSQFGKKFVELNMNERTALLNKLAASATPPKNTIAVSTPITAPKAPPDVPLTFFQLARELTLLGYFTSEIGATQAMAYVAVPGRYDGNVTMTPGQKGWATL